MDDFVTAALGLHVERVTPATRRQGMWKRPKMLILAAHVVVIVVVGLVASHIEHNLVLAADLLTDFVLGGVGTAFFISLHNLTTTR